jgi:putative ABC transport system permease protein
VILFGIALRSLNSRRVTVILIVFSIALSVGLFLGVEKVRTGARASFANTISNTDLIMGARSGGVQLLLYSVFRVGNATNNVSWQSYQDIAERREVEWIVPMSLGDSHRGFRVMGTTGEYFDRYKYRDGRGLSFENGDRFADLFDAVLGADVAAQLGSKVGDPIVIAHGLASFTKHNDKPFQVSGILEKTGTPVDRTVLISLKGIEAIHVDWRRGSKVPGWTVSVERVRRMELKPKAITAAMIGVKSRLKIFSLQRAINDYDEEPLLAILPGVALQELWEIVGVAEIALIGVSAMVVATSLLGMAAMIFSGLNERRREMAILRAVGAGPSTILWMLMLEAAILAVLGAALGLVLLYTGLWLARPYVDMAFGLYLPIDAPTIREFYFLFGVVVAGGLVSIAPALRAYGISVGDGMTIKN